MTSEAKSMSYSLSSALWGQTKAQSAQGRCVSPYKSRKAYLRHDSARKYTGRHGEHTRSPNKPRASARSISIVAADSLRDLAVTIGGSRRRTSIGLAPFATCSTRTC